MHRVKIKISSVLKFYFPWIKGRLMELFLSSWIFRFIIFPLISVGLGIFVKWVSQNDNHSTFSKEDLAVGFELTIVALLTYISVLTSWALELSNTAISTLTFEGASTVTSGENALKDILERQEAIEARLTVAPIFILLITIGLWGMSTTVRKIGWQAPGKLRTGTGVCLPLFMGLTALLSVSIYLQV